MVVGLSLPLRLVAVRDLGPVPSAIHQNLGPFYVLALGLLLGQGLAFARALAATLVVAGALLAQLDGPRSAVARGAPWRAAAAVA